MTIASNRRFLKFELLAIYPQQRDHAFIFTHAVMDEINDAWNNINNVTSLSMHVWDIKK